MSKNEGSKPAAEVRRSASQISFGHLPEQTVDINGGIWKVTKWRNTKLEHGVDTDALMGEVLAAASPWANAGKDHDFSQNVRSGRRKLTVRSLNRDDGIEVSPFPKIWRCHKCHRVHRNTTSRCQCGAEGGRQQVHFVCFCTNCGDVSEPPIFTCKSHNEVTLEYPGTMSASQIIQRCPSCQAVTRKGFAGAKCPRCSRQTTAQVHRAASVFTPRSVVIVNAADRAQQERLEHAGGAPGALDWVINGMQSQAPDKGAPSVDAMRALLRDKGVPEALIGKFIADLAESGVTQRETASIPEQMREDCEKEARAIALGLMKSRATLKSLQEAASEPTRDVYKVDYPKWLRFAGLSGVDLADRFPVLTGMFGFTRGSSTNPQESILVPFQDDRGDYVVYGETMETEALFVRLDAVRVLKWLCHIGATGRTAATEVEARLAILQAMAEDPTGDVRQIVTTLVHSYCHRFIRIAAVYTGTERSSLSEYLVPSHLGFFVYAAARGDFVLGGLQAVFEGELHRLLKELVDGEHRCALDPGCGDTGGACMACLHLGEPSCRLFNQHLDRATLSGPDGYLTFQVGAG
ncbi:hypothetical protein [Microvirga sp. CF3016]|uniref:hypothetical protein n=1 Tax=Microvirga sp. CF3016 TaxID=3110181 RepID=UPI002E75C29B|nr:hypothetical protein [Microvirga sp. CF3016]MEE1611865.1 hypothetical protein [Microvirga sp. CF3016]